MASYAPGRCIVDGSMAILGRDAERERLERFVVGLGPAMLLVEGEPGIGKTTLWRHGTAVAEQSGMRVLAVRPGEAERPLAFAGLAGLLTDALLNATLPSIPEPRRRALDAALLRDRGSDRGQDADPGTVGLAVLSVLGQLAVAAPVLVALDDLQWVDEATLRALEFALRRLGTTPVSVLATRRGAVSAEPAETAPLELAFPEDRRERLVLGGLSVGSIGRLVHDRLGLALPRPVVARLREEAGGNPFLALELARAIAAQGRLPTPGEPLRVVGDAGSVLAGRITRLPPTAGRLLLALAALAHPTVELLERALGEQAVAEAIPQLVATDLARLDGSDVRCAHPLVASVAYSAALPARRREVHERLAAVVHDTEQAARHRALAAIGPDESVAAALDGAAEDARRRGASDEAAELAELAVRLSPTDDPMVVSRRESVVARRRLGAGSAAEAREAACRSLELLPPGPGRIETLVLLAMIEQDLAELGAARGWLRRALDEAGDDRAALARAHVAAASMAWYDVNWEREHAQAALDLLAGHETDDPESVATAMIVLADTDLYGGHGPNFELIDRAVRLEASLDVPLMARPSTSRANYLGHAGRHSESAAAIEAVLAAAEREGDWTSRPHLLRCLAWVDLCAGHLQAALGHADEAEALAEELGLDDGNIWAVSGHVRAALGRLDEARDRCRRAVDRARAVGNPWAEIRAIGALGFLELTVGDPAAAVVALAPARAALDQMGLLEPGWYRVDGDLAEALVMVGRLDEAENVIATFESRAAGGCHPWSMVVSARARGLLEAARGADDAAIRSFERSLATVGLDQMAVERGRTLLALGATLRRANRRRAARAALEESITVLAAAGCVPWTERARVESAGVSGRIASPTELTGMERRVAELVAAGRTNREVAVELFLSVRTVESHLSSAYGKLDVRSRTELGVALAERRSAG